MQGIKPGLFPVPRHLDTSICRGRFSPAPVHSATASCSHCSAFLYGSKHNYPERRLLTDFPLTISVCNQHSHQVTSAVFACRTNYSAISMGSNRNEQHKYYPDYVLALPSYKAHTKCHWSGPHSLAGTHCMPLPTLVMVLVHALQGGKPHRCYSIA